LNHNNYNLPLHPKDTEKQTFGCRKPNPDICVQNLLPNVCAFVCEDNICLNPSNCWPKQYLKLKKQKNTSPKNKETKQ
jgi:hypothetical protein